MNSQLRKGKPDFKPLEFDRFRNFNYPEFGVIKKSNCQEIFDSYNRYFGKTKKRAIE